MHIKLHTQSIMTQLLVPKSQYVWKKLGDEAVDRNKQVVLREGSGLIFPKSHYFDTFGVLRFPKSAQCKLSFALCLIWIGHILMELWSFSSDEIGPNLTNIWFFLYVTFLMYSSVFVRQYQLNFLQNKKKIANLQYLSWIFFFVQPLKTKVFVIKLCYFSHFGVKLVKITLFLRLFMKTSHFGNLSFPSFWSLRAVFTHKALSNCLQIWHSCLKY